MGYPEVRVSFRQIMLDFAGQFCSTATASRRPTAFGCAASMTMTKMITPSIAGTGRTRAT
jgi:hypothetical protein